MGNLNSDEEDALYVQRLMCETVRIAAVNTFISNEEQKLEGEAAS